jgi:hypothetical protein
LVILSVVQFLVVQELLVGELWLLDVVLQASDVELGIWVDHSFAVLQVWERALQLLRLEL